MKVSKKIYGLQYLPIVCFFSLFLGCSSTPGVPDEAIEKSTTCRPAYDVLYERLWKAAITAVQELGYPPVSSYRGNYEIKTDLKPETQDLIERIKTASMVYISFREQEGKKFGKSRFVLKICVPRYESPLNEEKWSYIGSDTNAQMRIRDRFEEVLERMYRKGFGG